MPRLYHFDSEPQCFPLKSLWKGQEKQPFFPGKSDWQQESNYKLQDIFLTSGDQNQKKILHRILEIY